MEGKVYLLEEQQQDSGETAREIGSSAAHGVKVKHELTQQVVVGKETTGVPSGALCNWEMGRWTTEAGLSKLLYPHHTGPVAHLGWGVSAPCLPEWEWKKEKYIILQLGLWLEEVCSWNAKQELLIFIWKHE